MKHSVHRQFNVSDFDYKCQLSGLMKDDKDDLMSYDKSDPMAVRSGKPKVDVRRLVADEQMNGDFDGDTLKGPKGPGE